MSTGPCRHLLCCLPFVRRPQDMKFAGHRICSAEEWLHETPRVRARAALKRLGSGRLDYPVLAWSEEALPVAEDDDGRHSFGDTRIPAVVTRFRNSAFVAYQDALAGVGRPVRGMIARSTEQLMVRAIAVICEGRQTFFSEMLGPVVPRLHGGLWRDLASIALPSEPIELRPSPLLDALSRHSENVLGSDPLWHALELYTAAFCEIGQVAAFARFVLLWCAIEYLRDCSKTYCYVGRLGDPEREGLEWPGHGADDADVHLTRCWANAASELRNEFAHGSERADYRTKNGVPDWTIDEHLAIAEAVFRHAVKRRLHECGARSAHPGHVIWYRSDGGARASRPMCASPECGASMREMLSAVSVGGSQ